MNLTELQKEIHENAKAHGWWDKEVPIEERLFLCISELAEAGEEIRNGHDPKEIYYSGAPGQQIELGGIDKLKPEGYPVELADFEIRLIDIAAGLRIVLDDYGLSKEMGTCRDYPRIDDFFPFLLDKTRAVLFLMENMSHPNGNTNHYREVFLPTIFYKIICNLIIHCETHGINREEAIRIKMRYNKNRPFRHGGKLA